MTEFDMMMLRSGAHVPDTLPVRRDIATRKYLLRRKLCRIAARNLTRAAKWFETREARYAKLTGATA